MNISILNQKIVFSVSAKIGLSCGIKSLSRKSVHKKLQIFTSIFFFELLYNDLIPLSNIFRSQKKIIKFPSLLIKLWSLKKHLHNKKLDFNTLF